MKIIRLLVFFLLFTIPAIANDFYSSNITPASGALFNLSTPIFIEFDVWLGFDFPANAGEWHVENIILDSEGHEVYYEIILWFDANGSTCYQIK